MPSLRLTLRCDNRCIMCSQHGVDAAELDTDAAREAIDALVPEGALVLTGGEPLLRDDLEALIEHARARGFERVGLQTNARGLAGRAASLRPAGLTDVHLSIHGASGAVHEYHTGSSGSFEAIRAALASCRRAGIAVVATTVLTRSNARVLSSLPTMLRDGGVSRWMIAIPHVAGRAAMGFDRIVPRIGLAVPYALHALRSAEALDLPARITGAPACALGPFADRMQPCLPRAYAEPCSDCAARPACPGVDPIYLARFGAEELRPRDAVEPVAAWPMFCGPGELAGIDLDTPEPPAAARRRLPVLGKSQPAVAEVNRGANTQTGPQLGQIFPELFDPDGDE